MAYAAELHVWIRETVNSFRVAVLATIAFLASLMGLIAVVAVVFDVNDRGLGVIGIVLTALTGLVGSVIVYLKIDGVEVKADDAAQKATVAAQKASVVERKVDDVHHDMLNGGMRENIKKAYEEIDADPNMEERRIQRIAAGVQRDRHDLQNRQARKPIRDQLERRGLVPRDTPEEMGG